MTLNSGPTVHRQGRGGGPRRCPACALQVADHVTVCPQDGAAIFQAPETALAETYEFIGVIGWGGMSIIYKARHRRSGAVVAIKMLHSLMMTEQVFKRFQQEADAISSLRHPNIISVHDFGVSDQGQPYMVMDYIEGRNLSDVISENGALSIEDSLHRFIQLCDALQHAHDLGVLHRDLKPSNIMLASSAGNFEDARIVDFGIAKLLDRGGKAGHLTQTGELFGSPYYMSPEQCRGGAVDVGTDIYSMGCVMFETLTGRPPFQGATVVETIMKQINEQPISLSEARPDKVFSDELENIIAKALAKNPLDRYRTMHELELALMQIHLNVNEERSTKATLKTRPQTVTPLSGKSRLTKPVIIASVVSLCTISSFLTWCIDHIGMFENKKIIESGQIGNVPSPAMVLLNREQELRSFPRETLTDRKIASLLDTDLNVQSIDLSDAKKISDDGLLNLKKQTKLQQLNLSNCLNAGFSTLPSTISRLTDLDNLILDGTGVDDAGLKKIAELKKLINLSLVSTRITDIGLEAIGNTPVKRLNLSRTKITDKGLSYLAKMKGLTELNLSATSVTDNGLNALKAIPTLKVLHLSQTLVSDAGIRDLREIPLDELSLAETNVTDAGAISVSQIRSLSELSLEKTLVTDKAMPFVAKLKGLKSLLLNRTVVSDFGLQYLKSLPQLFVIGLQSTDVTDKGMEILGGFAKLNYVNVSGCRYISRPAIEKLVLKLRENLRARRETAENINNVKVDDWKNYEHLESGPYLSKF